MVKKSEEKEETLADKIWNNIKEVDLNLASLPDQLLQKHAERFDLAMDRVHLKPKSGMVTPLLEAAVNNKPFSREFKYNVDVEDQFVVVKLVAR